MHEVKKTCEELINLKGTVVRMNMFGNFRRWHSSTPFFLLCMLVCLFSAAGCAPAQKWMQTDEYRNLKELHAALCIDVDFDEMMREPFADEPNTVQSIAPLSTTKIYQACEHFREELEMLKDEDFVLPERWTRDGLFYTTKFRLITLHLFGANTGNFDDYKDRIIGYETGKKCGFGQKTNARRAAEDLKRYEKNLNRLWLQRRFAKRLRSHAEQTKLLTKSAYKGDGRRGPIAQIDRFYSEMIGACEAQLNSFRKHAQKVKAEHEAAEYRRAYAGTILPVFRNCPEEVGSARERKASYFQSKIQRCKRHATDKWRTRAALLVKGKPEEPRVMRFLSELDGRLSLWSAELLKAQENEAICRERANASTARDMVLAWKECMSEAAMTRQVNRYIMTDKDLYKDFMTKKARECGDTTELQPRLKTFYEDCAYATENPFRSGWVEVENLLYPCFDLLFTSEDLCLEDMIHEEVKKR